MSDSDRLAYTPWGWIATNGTGESRPVTSEEIMAAVAKGREMKARHDAKMGELLVPPTPTTDTEEGRFIRALIDSRFSRDVRLQFADWLEEQGRADEAMRMRASREKYNTATARRKHQKKVKHLRGRRGNCKTCGGRITWRLGDVSDDWRWWQHSTGLMKTHAQRAMSADGVPLPMSLDNVPLGICALGHVECRPRQAVLHTIEDEQVGRVY